jgi:hypothetical protein
MLFDQTEADYRGQGECDLSKCLFWRQENPLRSVWIKEGAIMWTIISVSARKVYLSVILPQEGLIMTHPCGCAPLRSSSRPSQ